MTTDFVALLKQAYNAEYAKAEPRTRVLDALCMAISHTVSGRADLARLILERAGIALEK